ncbi:hypothetical protein OOU_Y34scaffold00742g2 [Pyricularia oryzae Y34]|uniref:Uncharacterized protein n=2 Tax=Pyricularia oryzae TaxID=318829 RepID=A0AA97NRA1_PYRO3|nr:hypothetical protein OOU_Y34scaffold00742g2 [Pyricularia oryzae Y34]
MSETFVSGTCAHQRPIQIQIQIAIDTARSG